MIDPLFSSTLYSRAGLEKHKIISEEFTRLLHSVEELLPGGSRELSIIKAKLEEAAFYAKKALRNYKENVA